MAGKRSARRADLAPFLVALPAHRLKPRDLNQSGRSTAAQIIIMAFDLRRLSIIEVAAIAIIVVSLAVIAFVGFSMWAEP
jgi:hypothetical protein